MLGSFLNFNDQKFLLGVRSGSTQMCFGLWESVGVCGHVISLLSLCECVWVLNKIISSAPYARGKIAVMGKAEGHWKNKLGLLKERWLKGQFSCKVASGFSIRENFQAGWSPEGPRVFIWLASATSWLWPGHRLPSDSGLAQPGSTSRSVPSVLICSPQRCLFSAAAMGACQP